MTRYGIFAHSTDISVRFFDTQEEADSVCADMNDYHQEETYMVKEV